MPRTAGKLICLHFSKHLLLLFALELFIFEQYCMVFKNSSNTYKYVSFVYIYMYILYHTILKMVVK